MTKRKEKIILILLAAINFTHAIDFTIMMPLGPQLTQYFNISHQYFSYLVSAYTISASISGFFMAFFVDMHDRKNILLLGYTGFILGTLGCGLAPNYEILLLMRIVAGLFGGLISTQILSIIGDIIPFERRGEAMGVTSAAFSVASVLGLPFGLYLATRITWHIPFILVGLIGIAIIPLIYRFLSAMKGHITYPKSWNPIQVIQPILQSKNQQMGILLILTLTFGQFIMMPYFASHMVSNVGLTDEQLPLIYLFSGSCTLFTSPIIGKISDTHGKFRVLFLGIIASTIMAFLLTNLPIVPLYLALIFTTLFFIVTGARIIPAQAITTSLVPQQQRGSYMSILTSLQQFIMGFATFIAGNIVQEDINGNLLNYHFLGYIGVIVSTLGMFITLRLRHISRG